VKAPSPIAVIRSTLGPEQADALLRGGIAVSSLARTVLEATAPADLAATLTAAGLEKAEPLSTRTVLAVQNLIRLNQMRADRAVREAALGKTEKKPTKQDDRRRQFWQGTPPLAGKDRYGRTKDEKKTPKTQEAKKAERAPKLPPDQHGIGPKHEPEEKIAPTKQLEPQVHQNRGAKRQPAALEKRSKNVKEQTTGITRMQAMRRRQQYARSLGLEPQNAGSMAELRDLKGKGNQLKYGGKFDLPHELGHAMQTRPGSTLSEHMAGITPDDQFDDDTINTALEHRIDRRAGVDPHKFAGEFRGTIGDPEYQPPDDFIEGEDEEPAKDEGAPPIEWNADLRGRHGRSARRSGLVDEALSQQADRAEYANRTAANFDLGHRFDPSGKLRAPEGIDAKINRRAGMLKSDAAEWRSLPILRPEDAQDLDHAAAARSLSSGSAQEGERQAYEEYSRQQRLDAMAHHFRQAGEAQKRGDRPTSDRHMLAYASHARALGIDPAGHPPPEVGERIRQLAGKKAAFRGHPADRLA
jgi:hypothetical protein